MLENEYLLKKQLQIKIIIISWNFHQDQRNSTNFVILKIRKYTNRLLKTFHFKLLQGFHQTNNLGTAFLRTK